MPIDRGMLVLDNGELQVVDGTGGVLATAVFIDGWAVDKLGKPYVIDVGVGAIPGTAIMNDGAWFSPAGALYVTTQGPNVGDYLGNFFPSVALRGSDGALRVNTTGPGASAVILAGLAVHKIFTYLYISVPGAAT
jgi:hypothetical protein